MGPNAIDPLHDFFITLGGAAAALLGLLFVAVSINVATIVKHDDARELARQTFISLVAVLFYALYVLLPQQVQMLGVELVATSAVLIVSTAPRFVRSFSRERSTLPLHTQLVRFGIALLLQLGAFAIGVALVSGNAGAASWLVAVTLILLGSAARNSWEMLLAMGRPPA